MNKLTKLGIVTFSAVTLSAAVPTLVRAEENVAPQPNVAAKPNVAQPTPAPKPNGSWVDFSMLDPIAKPKPGKEVSKPAEKLEKSPRLSKNLRPRATFLQTEQMRLSQRTRKMLRSRKNTTSIQPISYLSQVYQS
ncbi:hypothetical protein [Streptococcus bouchesdurhonensis]|uniref:hypothetical protein n=1 Tax=Streptococcus bouchesdurhonensis TaxID=2954240 RepID=UPI0021C2A125|nr:hypothetical protein [Streptococcus bouchesdurhonensis]